MSFILLPCLSSCYHVFHLATIFIHAVPGYNAVWERLTAVAKWISSIYNESGSDGGSIGSDGVVPTDNLGSRARAP